MAELTQDLTPSERAVDLVEFLRSGKRLTTVEVARRYGLTRSGALRLLHRVSRIAPITQLDGSWRYVGAVTEKYRAGTGCVIE